MAPGGERLFALYREYGPVIYWRCRSILGDDAAAEDATQETFVKVHRQLEAAPDRDAALAWIFRIATHHCLNEVRARRRRPEPREVLPELPAGAARVDDVLADRQLDARIMDHIDEKLRVVGWLHHVDGLEQTEIARVQGITRQTVANRLRELRERALKIVARST